MLNSVNRRIVVKGLTAAAAVGWPLVARAQQPGKVYRVGLILTLAPISDITGPDPANPRVRAFVHALRDLGYVEGRNLILERRSVEGKFERFAEFAAELAGRDLDVIVTSGGNALAQEFKRTTRTVPIVMLTSTDPVAAGLVASLARPGGNITGFTIHTGPEFDAKRLQLLKEAVPAATRVAFLGSKSDWESANGNNVRDAARTMGVTLVLAEHAPTDFSRAFAQIARDQPQALFVTQRAGTYANREVIAGFAVGQRLPGMYPYRDYVELGGLMSYGTNPFDLYRRAAGHVDKILRGAKPADIPVEQPTKFELVINAKTAKSLGLTIPPALLNFADEVIE